MSESVRCANAGTSVIAIVCLPSDANPIVTYDTVGYR
jgi:hypothetical protein